MLREIYGEIEKKSMYELFQVPKVTNIVRAQRIRGLGLVERMP